MTETMLETVKTPSSRDTPTPITPAVGERTPDQWDDRWAAPLTLGHPWQLQQGMVPIALPLAAIPADQFAQQAALAQRIAELESQLGASQSRNVVLEARLRVAELEAQLGSTEAVRRELERRYSELESVRLTQSSPTQDDWSDWRSCSVHSTNGTRSPVQLDSSESLGHSRFVAHETSLPAEVRPLSSHAELVAQHASEDDPVLEGQESQRSCAEPCPIQHDVIEPQETCIGHEQAAEAVLSPMQKGISSEIKKSCIYEADLPAEVRVEPSSAQARRHEASCPAQEQQHEASVPGPQSESEDRGMSLEALEAKESGPEPSKRSRPRKRNAGKRGYEKASEQGDPAPRQQARVRKTRDKQSGQGPKGATSAAAAVVDWSSSYLGRAEGFGNLLLTTTAVLALCAAVLWMVFFPTVKHNSVAPVRDGANSTAGGNLSDNQTLFSPNISHSHDAGVRDQDIQDPANRSRSSSTGMRPKMQQSPYWVKDHGRARSKRARRPADVPRDPASDMQRGVSVAEAESVTSFGSLGDEKNKWWSGVVAPNGFIYGIPSSASQVLKIDPRSDSFKLFGRLGTQKFKWVASVVAKNGIIYGIPAAAGVVLRIDPYSDSIKPLGNYRKMDSKWTSAVLSACGTFIYGIPNSAGSVLKIDSTSDDLKLIGNFGNSKFKWTSGVLALNGAIYGIPANIESVLKIDPSSDTVTLLGSLSDQRNKWSTGVLAGNGAIYALPNNARSVLKIDPETDAVDLLGDLGNASFKYWTGVVARSDMIYGVPWYASSILMINPAVDTVETFGAIDSIGSMWRSAELGLNGEIFAIPFNASQILVIDPRSNSFGYCGSFQVGNKWRFAAIASNGHLYSIPVSADRILKIDTSNTSLCNSRSAGLLNTSVDSRGTAKKNEDYS